MSIPSFSYSPNIFTSFQLYSTGQKDFNLSYKNLTSQKLISYSLSGVAQTKNSTRASKGQMHKIFLMLE